VHPQRAGQAPADIEMLYYYTTYFAGLQAFFQFSIEKSKPKCYTIIATITSPEQ
jgi:hypothetical protein